MRDHFQLMADYNRWMNGNLHRAAGALPAEAEVYLCGSNGFVHAVRDQLTARDVPAQRLHFRTELADLIDQLGTILVPGRTRLESGHAVGQTDALRQQRRRCHQHRHRQHGKPEAHHFSV